MGQEPAETTSFDPAQPASQFVHGVMHFLRVVRYRKHVVFASAAVVCLLGAMYFGTATRLYESKASLLILQTGGDVNSPSMSVESGNRDIMPTYQRLITSDVVLRGAIRNLHPKHRVDLRSNPREKWVGIVYDNLTAKVIRRTNIIELSYRSTDSEAAAAVVRAVINSYLDFIDKTHRGTATEIIRVLSKEKTELEQTLQNRQGELLEARRQFGDLGLKRDGHVVHPLVQRAIRLNDALIAAQEKRLEQQSFLASLKTAISSGEDLQQYVMATEATVGREILLSGLGLNANDAAAESELERKILDDRATLQSLSRGLGPNHPQIAEVQARIELSEQYLHTHRGKARQRMADLQGDRLGPMLVQMLEQACDKAVAHENSLRVTYDHARADAITLNGDMSKLEILEHDVQRLRNLHDAMVNSIAGIDLRQEQGDIRATVVQEPVPSKRPVAPQLAFVVVVCVVASLSVGGAIVYVLDILDDRFRSPEELRVHLGVPVLALVRELPAPKSTGLSAVQTSVAPDAAESEAFRTLRTAIAFSREDSERLVISSSEPGDGKTTVLVNLAVSIAQSGKKTLLVDADLRRPGLTALLGMKALGGLTDVLRLKDDVAATAHQYVCSTEVENLDVLPSGMRRPNPAELLAGPNLGDLLGWADTVYDQVLIDSPPVLAASDAQLIGRLVDGVIMVVNSEKNRRRAVVRAVESFVMLGVHVFGVVANRVGGEGNASYGYDYGYAYDYSYSGEPGEDTDQASNGAAANDTVAFPNQNTLDSIASRRVA